MDALAGYGSEEGESNDNVSNVNEPKNEEVMSAYSPPMNSQDGSPTNELYPEDLKSVEMPPEDPYPPPIEKTETMHIAAPIEPEHGSRVNSESPTIPPKQIELENTEAQNTKEEDEEVKSDEDAEQSNRHDSRPKKSKSRSRSRSSSRTRHSRSMSRSTDESDDYKHKSYKRKDRNSRSNRSHSHDRRSISRSPVRRHRGHSVERRSIERRDFSRKHDRYPSRHYDSSRHGRYRGDYRRSRGSDRRSRDRDSYHSRHRRRSRSRSKGEHRHSRSHSRDRRRSRSHSYDRKKSRSRSRDRRYRRSMSRDRNSRRQHSRSRSGSPVRKRSSASDGKNLPKDPLAVAEAVAKSIEVSSEKSSNLPLNPTGMMGQITPQQAVQQAMAAMNAKAQQMTGIALPKYYNPAAVNPLKYAEQMQKRKLLWHCNKEKTEDIAPSTNNWENTTFAQDQDGKMTAKFRKLMGMKPGTSSGSATTETPQAPISTDEQIRKQEELFKTLDQQYEAARMSTHTHRGVGLGFSSQPHHLFPK